jgi:hypothetical protein
MTYPDQSFFLYLIKDGNRIKYLFPLLPGLVLILQFLSKQRKILLVCRFVMITPVSGTFLT